MNVPKKRKIGRPTVYTPQIAEEIFQRLAHGEGLRGICRDERMPDLTTVYRWIWRADEGEPWATFRKRYDRARMEQADTMADEITEIADMATAEDAHARRLQVDARKWTAARLRPDRWGDNMPAAPSVPTINIVSLTQITQTTSAMQQQPTAIDALPGDVRAIIDQSTHQALDAEPDSDDE